MVMKLFGIYHSKHPSDAEAIEKLKLYGNNWNQTMSQLYEKFIIFVHILNTFRYLLGFNSTDIFGFDTLSKVLFCSLSACSIFNAIIFYNASGDASKFYLFLKHCGWIKCYFTLKNEERFKCYTKITVKIGVILFISFMITNCGLFGYALFGTKVYDAVLTPFTGNIHFLMDTIARILFIVLTTYSAGAMSIPLSLLCSICKWKCSVSYHHDIESYGFKWKLAQTESSVHKLKVRHCSYLFFFEISTHSHYNVCIWQY